MAEPAPASSKLCRDCTHMSLWYERHNFGAALDFRCSKFAHPVSGLPLRCIELRTKESSACGLDGAGYEKVDRKVVPLAAVPVKMQQVPPAGLKATSDDEAQIKKLRQFVNDGVD